METVLENLCEGLLVAGVQVQALVSGGENLDRRQTLETPQGKISGVVVRAARLGQFNSQPLNPTFISLLRRQLETFSPDLVHLHWPNPLALLAWSAVARFSTKKLPPLVFWYHADITRQRRGAWALRPFLQRQLKGCAGLCVSSQSLVDQSSCLQGFREKTRIIPFGIAPDPWIQVQAERKGAFLFVGRLVAYKGLKVLLDALQMLPESHLDIVGDGPLRSELAQEIKKVGLAGRVTLHGFCEQEKLVGLMARARALVLPSLDQSETFGLVQLEAMASGVPVIASNLPTGVAEVGVDRETCLLVDPGKVESLVDILREVQQDDALVERLGRNSRLRFQEKFSRQTMVGQVLEWYQDVLNGNN